MITKNRSLWVLYLLAFLFVLTFLLQSPINYSFWLDESISVWIARSANFAELVDRASLFQAQLPIHLSILYFLERFLPCSNYCEVLMRVPSILAGILIILVLVFFLKRYTSIHLSILLSLTVLSVDQFTLSFMSARPYAIALACYSISLFLVTGELNKNRWLFMLASLVTCVLIQPTFLPGAVLVVLLANTRKTLSTLVLLGCVFPLIYKFIVEKETVQSWYSPLTLDWLSFVQIGTPFPFLLVLVVGIVIYFSFDFSRIGKAYSSTLVHYGSILSDKLFLLTISATSIIIFIALLDLVTGMTLFRSRYLLWAHLIIFFFILKYFVKIFTDKSILHVSSIVFSLLLLRELDRRWVEEDWRRVVQQVQIFNKKYQSTHDVNDTKILLLSELAEAKNWKLIQTESELQYLLTPALTYHLKKEDLAALRFVEGEWKVAYQDTSYNVVELSINQFQKKHRSIIVIGNFKPNNRDFLSFLRLFDGAICPLTDYFDSDTSQEFIIESVRAGLGAYYLSPCALTKMS